MSNTRREYMVPKPYYEKQTDEPKQTPTLVTQRSGQCGAQLGTTTTRPFTAEEKKIIRKELAALREVIQDPDRIEWEHQQATQRVAELERLLHGETTQTANRYAPPVPYFVTPS